MIVCPQKTEASVDVGLPDQFYQSKHVFHRSSFDPEKVAWQFDVYEWLLENFGGYTRFQKQTLVTPTSDFFPFTPRESKEYAEVVFETVKDYMGMDDWICRLIRIEDENPMDRLRKSSHFYGTWASAKSAAGLFKLDHEGAKIYYARSTLPNPALLIATLSHELSHYLISSTVTPPPGGWAQLEPMTDLTSVFRGFGIFLANSAFNVTQWADYTGSGWSASTHGYLTESELAFGLGIFCTLNDIHPKFVKKHLRPNPRSYFARAMKEMRHYEDRIQNLKEVVAVPNRQ